MEVVVGVMVGRAGEGGCWWVLVVMEMHRWRWWVRGCGVT